MIVLGADTHKSSHTIAAVDIATGQVVRDKTVAVGARGFGALLTWARALGPGTGVGAGRLPPRVRRA